MTDNLVPEHSYTRLPGIGENGGDIVVCDDCGAHADTESNVQHWPTCKPGESKHWQELYDQPEPDNWEAPEFPDGEFPNGKQYRMTTAEEIELLPTQPDRDWTQDDWDLEQTRLSELEEGRWDDDPSPYDGTYSEE